MYTQEELSNLSDEEKQKQKNSTQMAIVITESDLGKMTARKNELDSQIRKLRYEEERLRVEMDVKKREFEGLAQKITDSEAEIKRLRKRLNLL